MYPFSSYFSSSIGFCNFCTSYFWLSDLQQYPTDAWEDSRHQTTDYVVRRLRPLQLEDAIRSGFVHYPHDLLQISVEIWWAINDTFRFLGYWDKPKFKSIADEEIWKAALDRLVVLLNPRVPIQRLMLAEVHRNREEYSKCWGLLAANTNLELEKALCKMRAACMEKNRFLIRLSDKN